VVAGMLADCAPAANKPLSQPVELMEVPWGRFARQCASTRVSYATVRWRVGDTEVAKVYKTCIGFSAMPSGPDVVEITASVSKADRPSAPVILRIRRDTEGRARAAVPGDIGLLAQGSDVPEAAETLARDIGLTARQLLNPSEPISLPVQLSLPFPVNGALSCHPVGKASDHGRQTVVLSCTLDQIVHTDHLAAQVRFAGVEEIDVPSGVCLTSLLTGDLRGRIRLHDNAAWQSANDWLLYGARRISSKLAAGGCDPYCPTLVQLFGVPNPG